MIQLIIKKELKEILGSSRFVYSFVVCAVLTLITFYIGAKNYQITKSQYDAAVAQNIRSMSGISDWRMINHKIFLPPQPLSSLVSGISNDIGRNIKITGRGELSATDSRYNEDPIYAVFRFLDLNFLFQIIISLFAILFCFNAVNGEKENGTLRLVFSTAIPRDKFILGKLIGSFLALAVPLILPVLIGCLLLVIMGIPMTFEAWMKLLMIIISGFLLFGVFMNLSILFSVVTTRSSNSFLYLLIIWIFFVLIIPKASILIAGRAVNVPSIDEINSKKNSYAAQVSREYFNKLSGFKTENNANVMNEFQKFMEKNNEDRELVLNSFFEKLNGERTNKQNVQENVALNISRISPSASFSLATAGLAGTSLELVRQYREQAANYQKVFARFQKEKTGSTSGGGMMFIIRNDGDNKPPEVNPAELPKFDFKTQSFSAALYSSLGDFGLLIVFNIVFFGLAYYKFLKFDLR
jgi:ABC-type transport system involved in multi-copper enzyme maturation permease subunit